MSDPAPALGEGEAACLHRAPYSRESADVADGVGRDGALAACEPEQARERTAAGFGCGRAAAVADGGDELVEARDCGFAEPKRADAEEDMAVDVVAVEPGGVRALDVGCDVLLNLGEPLLCSVRIRVSALRRLRVGGVRSVRADLKARSAAARVRPRRATRRRSPSVSRM